MLQVDEITSTDALRRLADEWIALWNACADGTPFQHPAWVLPWWNAIGSREGWTLWTLTVRDNRRLVALAPWMMLGAQGDREKYVAAIGLGNSDYLEPLMQPAHGEASAAALLAHLASTRDRWDLCDLRELRARHALLRARVPDALASERSAESICPVVSLDGSSAAFFAARAAWLRRNLRNGRRHLDERGAWRFETADADRLPAFVDAFFRLHGERWQSKGERGAVDDTQVRAFHADSCERLQEAGVLRLHALRLEGRLVAVFLGMYAHRRVYAYLGGFEPALADCNPGSLIAAYAIECAIAEGAAELDFLRGAERYKYAWGATDRQTYRMQLRRA